MIIISYFLNFFSFLFNILMTFRLRYSGICKHGGGSRARSRGERPHCVII